MGLSIYSLTEALAILLASILWCEFGYYHFVFRYNCSGWPEPTDGGSKLTRFLVIADTHIMGPWKSARLDKMRREWEMKQAFSISNRVYQPDVVLFMGDLIDEGSFSPDRNFINAINDFESIFAFDREVQEFIVIPGNHDVGFHDQMIHYPHLMKRFSQQYRTVSNINLHKSPKTSELNMVLSNSMSFYNDSCQVCMDAISATNRLAQYLDNERKLDAQDFSPPILLTHIPLYRAFDLTCDYPSSIDERVRRGNVEGLDVIHAESSEFLLKKLRPRLILSGHTHMKCLTKHYLANEPDNQFDEITISSYNHKYAEKRPGFLLMSANSTHVYTRHCNLVEEWIIASVYIATIIVICSRLVITNRKKGNEEERLITEEKPRRNYSIDERL